MSALSPVRRFILPRPGDAWVDIARRELGAAPEAEAETVSSLQSWNLHVFLRANLRSGAPANPILPSDVIFIEPPLAAP